MSTDLDRVARYARDARADTIARDQAIWDAHLAKHTMREIGAAAGLSAAGVKKIIDRWKATQDRIDRGDEIRLAHQEKEFVARYQPVHRNWLVVEEYGSGRPVGRPWLLQDGELAAEVARRVDAGWLQEF